MELSAMTVAGWDSRYHSLPEREIRRRRERTRKLLEEKDLPVLLVFDMVRGGYFQWFTGTGLSERPTEEIMMIPRQGEVKVVLSQECFTDEQQRNYQKPDATNSQDSRFGAVNVPALYYGDIVSCLGEGERRVGVVYGDAVRVTVKRYLEEHIPGICFVDVTEELEAVKAVKSRQELDVLEAVAGLHDRLAAVAGYLLRPGRTEADIVRELRYRACQLGAGGEDMTRHLVVDLTSSAMGGPAEAEPLRYPGRRLQRGDRVNLRIQGIFLDDYYGILGRCYCLGEADEETRRLWNHAVAAQQAGAAALKPGATAADGAAAISRYLTENGFAEDTSANLYGIAYRIGEAPARYQASERMTLEPGMVLAVTPKLTVEGQDPYCCADAFRITETGAVRLTRTPQEPVEIRGW